MPIALRTFMQAHPGASVSVHSLESPALEQALTEQRHDLGLIEHGEAPPGTLLEPLLTADEVVVLPDGHPLLSRERLRPEDLDGQPFISFPPADPYRQQIDDLFARHDVERRMALDTRSAASVCAMVRQGLGLGIVNPLTAREMQGGGLQWRPLTVSIPFVVALVTPELKTPHPLVPACIAALKTATAEITTPAMG